jgi:proline iminopeptidase
VARSVADLDAVRNGLGVDRNAVLGHSWGATLALRYALDHPDRVSALIYVSGTGLGWAWPEPFQRAIAERLAPSAARRSELRGRARTEAEDRELEQAWREPELMSACQALNVPVLIIDGAADLRPRWAVDSLEQALPRVTRVILPGVGHLPWLELPAEFTALLQDFVCDAAWLPGRWRRRTCPKQPDVTPTRIGQAGCGAMPREYNTLLIALQSGWRSFAAAPRASSPPVAV